MGEYLLDALHLRHADRPRVAPVGTAVRRDHHRVASRPEQDVGAARVEEAVHRLRVNRLQVIGLEERVEQDLHVARDLVARARDVPMVLKVEVLPVRRDRAERLDERRGVRVLVDEHPVAVHLAADLREPHAARVEPREVAFLAHGHEPAVEVVGPAVVAAEESFGLALLGLEQRRAAVAAGVVEGPDAAVLAADDDDRRPGLAPHAEASRARQLVGVQRVEPGALPEILFLEAQEVRVGVASAGDRRQLRKTRRRTLALLLPGHALEKASLDRGFHRGHLCSCTVKRHLRAKPGWAGIRKPRSRGMER